MATVACPSENGAFLQPEAVALMGQGTQRWPWEFPRVVTVTCTICPSLMSCAGGWCPVY